MQAEVGSVKCEAVVSPSAMNKEEFSELACHCEEGEARRGNPFPFSRSNIVPGTKRSTDCHASVRTGSQ